MTKDSEQQRYLASLQRKSRVGRRRSLLLGSGLAAALLLSLVSWWIHYTSSVLSYAKLDPALLIERTPNDPERLTVRYRPLCAGTVGFGRVAEGRHTELRDEVLPEESNTQQKLEWRWSGVKQEDQLTVTFREGWSLVRHELTVPAAPPVPPLGDSILIGEVVNATNNQPVANAQVKLLGTGMSAGTDEHGRFRIEEAPAGEVAIEISAEDFSTDQFERELRSGEATSVRVALSPGMEAGQIRVVLTWDHDPADLDAHLEGPLPGENRFHVYFKEKGDLKSQEFVRLDVDDRDGDGPETITVLGVLPGRYHYFVHDYTNRGNMENTALSHSGAEVKLYQGGQTYRFSANDRSIGTVWHVCDIEVSEAGATFEESASGRKVAVVKKIDEYESVEMKGATTGTVVLLIDTSGSMSDLIGATKQACYGFLIAVPFEMGASAGLATFGAETGMRQEITDNRDVLRQAIMPLGTGNGTPMALGLEAAHDMLRDVRGDRSICLFTDGKPANRAATLEQGRTIKKAGIVIWAIGTLGADMDLLRQLASSPEKALFASPDDLQEIFGETADKIYAPVENSR